MKLKKENVKRGNVFMLLNNRKRLLKYINGIIIGMPIWFVVGILITFSPEFGLALGLSEPINAGKAVMLAFAAQVAGNLASGFLSQYLQSRKKAILVFILISVSFVIIYLVAPVRSATWFYVICACLGFSSGYWTLFITVAAELFGSNLRATVATTIPNFVRATVIPLTAFFLLLKDHTGIIYGALIVGWLLIY